MEPEKNGGISLAQPRPGTARRQNEYVETPLRPPVTAQPTTSNSSNSKQTTEEDKTADSIICRVCKRCRCEACRTPRHFPARWICDNKCLCSARVCVDYATCMCCVRACFYHWAKDHETDDACVDMPCSCAPQRRTMRWACLGLLSLPLPCLCLYWPLRGSIGACEAAYGRAANRGCRCPDRTLLDDC